MLVPECGAGMTEAEQEAEQEAALTRSSMLAGRWAFQNFRGQYEQFVALAEHM
jgi:hypothetical protein